MIDSGQSNTGHSNSRHGRSSTEADRGDPLVALTTAVRDMWLLGAASFENILMQGKPNDGSTPFAPYADQLLRAGSAFRDLTASNVNALTGIRKPPEDLLALLARVNTIAGVGGFRYWRKLAQINAARQSNIVHMLSASSSDPARAEEGRRALAEEFRAYLREVGDLALQEARVFQAELESLAAEVAGAASGGPAEYRRRWKAKS